MKKNILIILLALFSIAAMSQSLELSFAEEILEAGETITQEMHADSGMFSFHGLTVKNISTNPLNIMCAREVLQEVEDTQNSFCWGICYSPNMDTSTLSLKINSNAISEEFTGDYLPNGNSGVTKVRYIFYDLANTDDQIDFIIDYKATAESQINDFNNLFDMTSVYPNPANQSASIDYSLDIRAGAGRLIIYNLLGSVIKEIEVPAGAGTIRLNTSEFNEGIYFYSLRINNESAITQKLVVKH